MEPVRRLEHAYRVRFDEADEDGWLRPSGLLRYTQDMAWRHSEEAGFGRTWYAERGMSWLVRNVTLSIHDRVTYGDVLNVATQVIGWRHVWARRHTEIRRTGSSAGGAGSVRRALNAPLMATADTDWVLLTTEGRPARVPRQIAEYFARVGPFTRDRIVLPEPAGPVAMLETRVRPLDVDPMRHMNNAAYLDAVDDGLSRIRASEWAGEPDCYRVGYVRPALPDSPVVVRCWATGDGHVACRISDGDGIELTKALVSRSRG